MRFGLKFYLWLFLGVISSALAAFFVAATFKTKPFSYYGEMHIDAVKDLDINGIAIGRVVVVSDFHGEVTPGLNIIVYRNFSEGRYYSIETVTDYDEESTQILTDLTPIFGEILTKSDIHYIYLRDGDVFEILEYLFTKKEHAQIFSVTIGLLAILSIFAAVLTSRPKKEKYKS